MRKLRLALVLVGLGVACKSDSTSVNPDAVDGREVAAVRVALNTALGSDSFFTELSLFVFPYLDRATRFVEANGDTTFLVGVQLDVNATKGDTAIMAQFSALLGWRGYRPATQTVDSVYFLLGAGLAPPFSDSLTVGFSPDSAGTGTGFVVHQSPDSSVISWLTRQGAFHVAAAAYGAPVSQSAGAVTLAAYHGTMNGDYHLTAKLRPDSLTTATAGKSFSGGIESVKIRITGSLP